MARRTKRFIERATEGMNAKFSTNFSGTFVWFLIWVALVLVVGTGMGIAACYVMGDVDWRYFVVSYAVVAVLLVMAFSP